MKPVVATNISHVFTFLIQRAQVLSTSPKDSEVPKNWKHDTSLLMLETQLFCADMNLHEAYKSALRLQKELMEEGGVISSQELLWKLDGLRELMESEMRNHLYFSVKDDLARYVNGKALFGKVVQDAFPSIELDLKEAGNCLAFGCNTGAVFHLMRVAEVGLWELGRDRQIPLAQSGKIEFTEWGLIVRELEEAVKAIQQWRASSSKEVAHKFYNHAVVEIRAFNDGWRRHAGHARPNMPPMSPEEALASWGHVERFMKTLATRISEGKYNSLVW